jgi:hypothetical protein
MFNQANDTNNLNWLQIFPSISTSTKKRWQNYTAFHCLSGIEMVAHAERTKIFSYLMRVQSINLRLDGCRHENNQTRASDK